MRILLLCLFCVVCLGVYGAENKAFDEAKAAKLLEGYWVTHDPSTDAMVLYRFPWTWHAYSGGATNEPNLKLSRFRIIDQGVKDDGYYKQPFLLALIEDVGRASEENYPEKRIEAVAYGNKPYLNFRYYFSRVTIEPDKLNSFVSFWCGVPEWNNRNDMMDLSRDKLLSLFRSSHCHDEDEFFPNGAMSRLEKRDGRDRVPWYLQGIAPDLLPWNDNWKLAEPDQILPQTK